MRKILAVLFGVSLLFSAACAEEAHEHSFVISQASREAHWMACECGEMTEAELHVFDEYGITCTLCGGEVFQYEDGAYCIYLYDEAGNMTLMADYDAAGELVYHWYIENEYNEDGVLVHTNDYVNGVLNLENFYQPGDAYEGEIILIASICYAEDGSYERSEWDLQGNLLWTKYFAADGSLLSEESYEYEFDAEGNCVHLKAYLNDAIQHEMFYAVGQDGELHCVRDIYYNDDGTEINSDFTYTYEYDESNRCAKQTTMYNGVLEGEVFFEVDEEGFSYAAHEIWYAEDGSIYSEYKYDSMGNEIE